MNDKQAKAIQRYIDTSARRIGLGHWRIVFDPNLSSNEVSGTSTLACILPQASYRRADVYVSPEFFERTPEEQSEVLFHELCHIFLARLDECVESIRPIMGSVAYSVWEKSYADAVEDAVDSVAKSLAKHAPPLKL